MRQFFLKAKIPILEKCHQQRKSGRAAPYPNWYVTDPWGLLCLAIILSLLTISYCLFTNLFPSRMSNVPGQLVYLLHYSSSLSSSLKDLVITLLMRPHKNFSYCRIVGSQNITQSIIVTLTNKQARVTLCSSAFSTNAPVIRSLSFRSRDNFRAVMNHCR